MTRAHTPTTVWWFCVPSKNSLSRIIFYFWYTTGVNTLRIQGIIILLIVLIMYGIAQRYSLYYIFWWYDWVQHFLGGIALGLLGRSWWMHNPGRVLGITLACAVSWEIFERMGSLVIPRFIGYGGTGDTIIDIMCALVGTGLVILMTHSHESTVS